MKPSLIFCSVGQPLPNEGPYAENHWRRTDRDQRFYKTTIVNYKHESGFEPEAYSYDQCINKKGFKWPLAYQYIKENKDMLMSEYEYIGIWDDDIETTIEAVNHSIVLAHSVNAKIWQMSVTEDSEMHWQFLRNNPKLVYSLTNFAEIMCPVYHTSLIPMMIEFWGMYEFNTGWGFDTVVCELAESPAMVVHSQSMYHPSRKTSTYDKAAAFNEADQCINVAYPAYCKKHFDMDTTLNDRQVVYTEVKKVD